MDKITNSVSDNRWTINPAYGDTSGMDYGILFKSIPWVAATLLGDLKWT